MPRGAFLRLAVPFVVLTAGGVATSGDDASLGENDTRAAVKSLNDSTEQSRAELCARLVACANARWAAVTALECVGNAEDRVQKAAKARDAQGATMFAFFVNRVAKDFENRSKFTEFRVMEMENRTLCGVVQEWTHAVETLQDAAQKASARVVGDAEAATALADRVKRIVALNKRPPQQAAVLTAVRGDAARLLSADAHVWAGPLSDRELSTAAMRLLALAPESVDVAKLLPCASHVDHVVRRATYALFAAVADVPAMDALVSRLALEEGVPAGEIATHLHALTEETFGVNAKAWKDWWDAHRANWKREGVRVAQAEKIERQSYSRYFGLELKSARVLFVFDHSGSMSWGVKHKAGDDDGFAPEGSSKMAVAQRELTNAVQGLDERSCFNILGFGTSIEPFNRRPVRATKENRDRAVRWIAKLVPDGHTNLAGSVLAAFENTRPSAGATDETIADTIVVMSDGEPNCGPIAYATDVLAELRRVNADHMVTVHAVFLGVDGDEAFMRSLASEHGGQFVHHKQ